MNDKQRAIEVLRGAWPQLERFINKPETREMLRAGNLCVDEDELARLKARCAQ